MVKRRLAIFSSCFATFPRSFFSNQTEELWNKVAFVVFFIADILATFFRGRIEKKNLPQELENWLCLLDLPHTIFIVWHNKQLSSLLNVKRGCPVSSTYFFSCLLFVLFMMNICLIFDIFETICPLSMIHSVL